MNIETELMRIVAMAEVIRAGLQAKPDDLEIVRCRDGRWSVCCCHFVGSGDTLEKAVIDIRANLSKVISSLEDALYDLKKAR